MVIPATLPPSAQASLTTLATMVPRGDLCLPVDEALQPLFPQGGLVRGQVTGFGGTAAVSLAVASVARAVVAGSWLAVVGVDGFGIEAAGDLGVPLQRVVAVDGGGSALDWADRVSICADGFDVVLVARSNSSRSAPSQLTPSQSTPSWSTAVLRRVRQRLQARGSVLAVVDLDGGGRTGSTGSNGCDTYLDTETSRWVGVGAGHGALLARMVTVSAAGRRVPGGRRHQIWLPSHTGTIESVSNELINNESSNGPTNNHVDQAPGSVRDVTSPHGHGLVS